jgi:hypothetical protein
MTAYDVARAVARRWYITVISLLCATGFALVLLHNSGLYSTRTVVQFIRLQPSQVAIGPANGTEDENFISFAGAVASEVNNGRPISRYAWEDAPLYGAGVRKGILVGLPDAGGQWLTSFNRAEIEVQVVGPTQEWVEDRQRLLMQKIADSSRELQGPIYKDQGQRIRTVIAPLTSTVDHIEASRSQQAAAVLLMLIAGLIVGGWVSVRVDLTISERAVRRANMYLTSMSGDGRAGVL